MLIRPVPFSKQKKLLGPCLLSSIAELDEEEKAKLLGKIEDSIRAGEINPSLTLILQTVVVVHSGMLNPRGLVGLVAYKCRFPNPKRRH